MNIQIPLTVPKSKATIYKYNINKATHNTGKLMLFAGDQKVEHMNDDLVGAGLPAEVADPEHYFKIASSADIGIFAAHLGTIARYGRNYKNIPYLVKLNGKTNLIPKENRDPLSRQWIDVEDVIRFKKDSGLNIHAVGYTLYLGSEFEAIMLHQAAQIITDAHQNGLFVVLWIYPRGKSVKNEKDIHTIAGCAGVGMSLGADFVKVTYPYEVDIQKGAENFREVTTAAGRTGVLCVGGSKQDSKLYLEHVREQINTAGASGIAVGRNIYQQSLDEAVKLANQLTAIVEGRE